MNTLPLGKMMGENGREKQSDVARASVAQVGGALTRTDDEHDSPTAKT
jgi:hypothetical protein